MVGWVPFQTPAPGEAHQGVGRGSHCQAQLSWQSRTLELNVDVALELKSIAIHLFELGGSFKIYVKCIGVKIGESQREAFT